MTRDAFKLNRRGLLAGAAIVALPARTLAQAAAQTPGAQPAAVQSPPPPPLPGPPVAPSVVVDAMVRDRAYHGVVMLGRQGRSRFERTVGAADIEAEVPLRIDTPLGIASISKRLTAVAIMRLVDQGRLTLDAPITEWLPMYRADTGARVTLRRLLSNTSGVPNLFSPATRADPTVITLELTTLEAMKRFSEGDLAFEPGERFDYNLTNWIIVLAILEAVTGQAYPDAMRTLVLDPLRMRATTLDPETVGKSYRTVSPPVEWISPRKAYLAAAGGWYSTAGDLLRFGHRVYDESFLTPASRQALLTIEETTNAYALGGRIRRVAIDGADVVCAWETGNTAGYRSVLGHRLDGRGSVVLLNNAGMDQRGMNGCAEALLRARF